MAFKVPRVGIPLLVSDAVHQASWVHGVNGVGGTGSLALWENNIMAATLGISAPF